MIDRNVAERDNSIIMHKIITEMAHCVQNTKKLSSDDATTLKEFIDSNYERVITNAELARLIYKLYGHPHQS